MFFFFQAESAEATNRAITSITILIYPRLFATCFPCHFLLRTTLWVGLSGLKGILIRIRLENKLSRPHHSRAYIFPPCHNFSKGQPASNSIAFGTISRCQNTHYVQKFSPSPVFLPATAVTWRRRSLLSPKIKVIYSKAAAFHCAKCDRSITRSYILILH